MSLTAWKKECSMKKKIIIMQYEYSIKKMLFQKLFHWSFFFLPDWGSRKHWLVLQPQKAQSLDLCLLRQWWRRMGLGDRWERTAPDFQKP